MTTLKLACRLAFSGDIRQRWRQISVVLAGLAATLLVLAGTAMVHAAQDSDARISARSPVWAQSQDDAVLHLSARGMTLAGYGQFPVVWIEPAPGHEADPSAIPPGLMHLPAPGEAVLSEGLMTGGWSAADFGMKPSTAGAGRHGAIGAEGLATRSEGWIYARPSPGRSLGEGGALLYSRGYPGSASSGIGFETIPEVPRAAESLLGAVWMLLAPAAFLLFSAARAMSEVRDARARTLWRLGIASRRIRLLVALETALLSAAGAIPGAALWMAFLGSTSRVPLTVAELRPGALAVSLPAVIVVVLAVVTLAATSTALGRIWRRNVRTDARTVRPWHAAPLVVAFLMMAVGPWLPPTSGLRLYLLFGGLLLTFAALPMALPAVVQGLGGHMGRSSSPAVWLAGRRLALRSANLAKPAAMVGALVFVAGAAFALYDRLVAAEENHGSRAPFAAFRVDWRDQRPGDVAAAANASPTLAVLPLTGEESGSPQVHFGSCGQIKRLVRAPMEACEADGHLRDQFRAYFTQITAVVPVIGGGDNAHALYVIGAKQVTPHEVMRALAATMPAVNISELGGASKTRDPRAGWMLAGWTLATLVLTTALVREIGDRGLSSMHDIGHLLRLGLRREEIERSYRWSLLPPVAVAIPIGFLGAVLFALLGYELGITIGNLGRIALVAGIAGLISVATFAIVLRLQHRLSALED